LPYVSHFLESASEFLDLAWLSCLQEVGMDQPAAVDVRVGECEIVEREAWVMSGAVTVVAGEENSCVDLIEGGKEGIVGVIEGEEGGDYAGTVVLEVHVAAGPLLKKALSNFLVMHSFARIVELELCESLYDWEVRQQYRYP
jgi:hypothetical protein